MWCLWPWKCLVCFLIASSRTRGKVNGAKVLSKFSCRSHLFTNVSNNTRGKTITESPLPICFIWKISWCRRSFSHFLLTSCELIKNYRLYILKNIYWNLVYAKRYVYISIEHHPLSVLLLCQTTLKCKLYSIKI